MAHPTVIVLGYSEAAMLLRNPGGLHVGAVITIAGQREFAIECNDVPRILSLHFDDIEAPDFDDPLSAARVRLRQREAAGAGFWPVRYCRIDEEQTKEPPPPLAPPTADDARRIIEFAASIRETDGVVLCQCQAGISRSAAAALPAWRLGMHRATRTLACENC